MNDKKVRIRSTANATVGISLPEYRFSRTWPSKGTQVLMDKELLEEAMSRPGVQYLFDQGILYIDDMEVKKELGLEPEDAEEPTRIIIPDDKMVKRLLTVAPSYELKKTLETLPTEQINEFAQRAIESGDISLERSEIIKEIARKRGLSIDVAKAITLNKQAKEPEKAKTKE